MTRVQRQNLKKDNRILKKKLFLKSSKTCMLLSTKDHRFNPLKVCFNSRRRLVDGINKFLAMLKIRLPYPHTNRIKQFGSLDPSVFLRK